VPFFGLYSVGKFSADLLAQICYFYKFDNNNWQFYIGILYTTVLHRRRRGIL